jgi:hypothetical protein
MKLTPLITTLFLITGSFLTGCGSDSVTFVGTWGGDLPLIQNSCPFNVPQNQNAVFPIVVTPLSDGQLNVVAADGSSGGGVENDQELSFLVAGPPFGEQVVNTAPLTNCTVTFNFGLFNAKEDSAESQLYIDYNNCTDTTNGSTTSCAISYAGDANKVN